MRRAHPRVGGENVSMAPLGAQGWGSSPRGRGKRIGGHVSVEHDGLIPAWAGKTSFSRCPPRTPRAHPRVGGENLSVDWTDPNIPGSSPRGRGKPGKSFLLRAIMGLIPAWAGKTRKRPRGYSGNAAHPRVGGENITASPGLHGTRGSSPRGRGKLVGRVDRHTDHGLIPAWAGKT